MVGLEIEERQEPGHMSLGFTESGEGLRVFFFFFFFFILFYFLLFFFNLNFILFLNFT